MQRTLEPLQRRRYILHSILQFVQNRPLVARRLHLVPSIPRPLEHRQQPAAPGNETLRIHPHPNGYRRGHQHPRNRRMNPRLQERPPYACAQHPIDQRVPHARQIRRDEQYQEPRRNRQISPHDLARVEHRDHQHRSDVVDDGKRRQEYLQGQRRPRPQQRKHAQAERDVRRHRNPPPPRALPARVEREIDRRGHYHSPQRRYQRQRRLPRRTQIPDHDRALDLQADHEEEHRHQGFVQPKVQGMIQRPLPQPNLEVRMQHIVVGIAPRRIRQGQSGHGCQEQHDAARRLLMHEPLHRTQDMRYRRLRRLIHCLLYSIHS